jgi:sugar O-acyltransferase (sialic acid O-acetyltransferase NeuD family)
MLVIGAQGFAKQLLVVLSQLNLTKDLVFYDDLNQDAPDTLYDSFPVLHSTEEARDYFEKTCRDFTIGVAGVRNRYNIFKKFKTLGGNAVTLISPTAVIGEFDCRISEAVSILPGCVIENSVRIGKGTLVNLHTLITHDSQVGEFCELSPGVISLGRCTIGDYVTIGTGAIILPRIRIGNNAIIGAGAIVSKDIEAGMVAMGVPARVIRSVTIDEKVIPD